MDSAAVRNTPGWQAELRLRFNRDTPSRAAPSGRTRLVERHHKGPLIVQRPFYPEGDPCHVYLVHPPGGVVGGDELGVDVQVDAGAHALPWTECPQALGSAARLVGAPASDLRAVVRRDFVGTSTCTHLNDTLRSLADLPALATALRRQ